MSALVPIEIDGVTYQFSAETIARINPDGTMTCQSCGYHMPPSTDPRLRRINILWTHQHRLCRVTESDLSR